LRADTALLGDDTAQNIRRRARFHTSRQVTRSMQRLMAIAERPWGLAVTRGAS
jgi:hypothetical protein